MTMTDKIRRLIKKGKTAKEIAAKLKTEPNRVHTVKWLDKKKNQVTPEQSPDPAVREAERQYVKKVNAAYKTKKVLVQPDHLDKAVALIKTQTDLVNHPPHYKSGGIETIDFIEAKDLNYRLGNVVKYVSRAGRKNSDPVQDLEKAAWYLQREIAARKNA